MTTAPAPAPDAIDQAAGLNADHPLHAVRRQRATVVEHTQASHDALLGEPVQGLTTADRLRVAAACCEAAQAPALAAHYQGLLAALPAAEPPSAALDAMLAWSRLLTLQPRDGDRAALQTLRTAGLDDPAIVALAQLVAFLSYQTRVVAGLKAMQQPRPPAGAPPASPARAGGGAA